MSTNDSAADESVATTDDTDSELTHTDLAGVQLEDSTGDQISVAEVHDDKHVTVVVYPADRSRDSYEREWSEGRVVHYLRDGVMTPKFDGDAADYLAEVATDGGVETRTAYVRDDAGHGLVPIGGVELTDDDRDVTHEPDPDLDEDDPGARPDSCTCSLNVLLDGMPPCRDCEAAGFETLNEHDIPPADGGKGEPLGER